jgi:hypothetical protein
VGASTILSGLCELHGPAFIHGPFLISSDLLKVTKTLILILRRPHKKYSMVCLTFSESMEGLLGGVGKNINEMKMNNFRNQIAMENY